MDTSTRAGSVAVCVIGRAWRPRQLGDEPYSSRLFTDLDRLLGELHIPGRFELFAVAAGPGSFTGLRIGLTAVKAWAEAFGANRAGQWLEAIAVQAQALECGSPPFRMPGAARSLAGLRPTEGSSRGTNSSSVEFVHRGRSSHGAESF